MIIKILLVVFFVAIIVVSSVILKSRHEETEKMYLAAERIMQNEILDNSLKNPFIKGTVIDDPSGQKLMIDIKVNTERQKQSYVFNPSKVINIGRERNTNQITVNEALVSNRHCRIYLTPDGVPVLEDMSSNGTVVKRGMKSYLISNGQNCVLENGDKLIIGTINFKIKLFYFDITWI